VIQPIQQAREFVTCHDFRRLEEHAVRIGQPNAVRGEKVRCFEMQIVRGDVLPGPDEHAETTI